MIKVLVIDDEKMVRKGIIAIMNWDKFNMKVIGEAHNGRSAMEFLSENEVDLVMTDLTMPGLSDMKFISLLRETYPSIFIVILTMHQDFGIIQQALRYDVLDYITKAQIEKESADEILGRICERIDKKNQQKTFISLNDSTCNFNKGALIYFQNEFSLPQITDIANKLNSLPIQLDRKLVLFEAVTEKDLNPLLSNEIIAIYIDNIKNINGNSLAKIVYEYITKVLFYEYAKGKHHYYLDVIQFVNSTGTVTIEFKELQERRKNLSWIYDNELYVQYIKELISLHMNKDQLISFFYPQFVLWSQYINLDISIYFDETKHLNWWYKWEQWASKYRELLLSSVQVDGGQNACLYISKAISYINSHYCEEISLDEILHMVNMSKSYFSQIFKKTTGKTFSDYIKDLRIKKSKQLLIETVNPIFWISEKCGYPNEKYFRKVFKEDTGMQPKQFRMNANQGIKIS